MVSLELEARKLRPWALPSPSPHWVTLPTGLSVAPSSKSPCLNYSVNSLSYGDPKPCNPFLPHYVSAWPSRSPVVITYAELASQLTGTQDTFEHIGIPVSAQGPTRFFDFLKIYSLKFKKNIYLLGDNCFIMLW